ncbi:BofC C-terminal domain-containing protein [Paenibacillus sp. J5C_2022]|uniref:BofC C-terminal domain-containing protein n=1 Tax=Paenibacillus sp. J5C2022 TaxID=2977129 RepID=UPI0021D20AA5|nr:BofC C-terminal domain-containing protein [Paenibacillus sp. J5C2022]MCU6711113.1 BofC C-terminal domain-containing protein [Paenibacillus sp. J5C2022]
MMALRMWKRLKKRLRRSRGPLWALGGISAIWLVIAIGGLGFQPVLHAASVNGGVNDNLRFSLSLPEQEAAVEVLLKRVYICGEETESLGRMTARQLSLLLQDHREWKVGANKDATTVLVQEINDLSDYCKSNAYFGIDRDGNLSLYDGLPKEEKVLRTFFQLDIEFMESSLPKEQLRSLTAGIRISDMDEYYSVLSTFSDFAMEQNTKVMEPIRTAP